MYKYSMPSGRRFRVRRFVRRSRSQSHVSISDYSIIYISLPLPLQFRMFADHGAIPALPTLARRGLGSERGKKTSLERPEA